jgi:hypothetical protein
MKTKSVKTRLNRKLNPTRFPHITGLMAVVLGHILDVHFVSPAIRRLENPRSEGAESTLTGNAASPFPAEPRQRFETNPE